ncbi:hypothetical protein KCU60_g13677, partial [Aureobasidium melanogenum]
MCLENCKVFIQHEHSIENIVNVQFKQIDHDINLRVLLKLVNSIELNEKQLNATIQLPFQQHNISLCNSEPIINLKLLSSSQQTLLR